MSRVFGNSCRQFTSDAVKYYKHQFTIATRIRALVVKSLNTSLSLKKSEEVLVVVVVVVVVVVDNNDNSDSDDEDDEEEQHHYHQQKKEKKEGFYIYITPSP